MNGQKDFRIKNSKQSLPKMHASVVATVAAPKGKPPVKYSDLILLEKKDALLHTIIEEHMIKFGYLGAFDFYSREVLDKEAQALNPIKNSQILKKNTQSLRLSDIKQEILKVDSVETSTFMLVMTSSSTRFGKDLSRKDRLYLRERKLTQFWSLELTLTWQFTTFTLK